MKRVLIFVTLIFLTSSCAHQVVKTPTGLLPETFWAEQKKRSVLDSLEGRLRLSYRGKNSVSGSGRFWIDKDKLRLELRDPLGRVQYRVVYKEKDFAAIYPRSEVAYVDSVRGKKYVEEFLGLAVPFSDLVTVLLGKLPVKNGEVKKWEWDGEGYFGEITPNGDTRLILWVDGDSAALKKMEWRTVSGKLQVEYQDFSPCCSNTDSVPFAHLATVTFGGTGNKLEIEWDDAEPLRGNDPERFAIEFPKNVRKVVLK